MSTRSTGQATKATKAAESTKATHAAQPSPRKTARRAAAEPRPYHHGNLRQSLLDAADALLAERGAQGLTLRDVARAAGVSHAAPYHHFASLQALLAALAERGFDTLSEALVATGQAPDPRERMLRIAQAYVACARAHPARFRLMFGPLLASKDEHPDFKAAANRAFAHVVDAARAIDPRHAEQLALAGWSLSHGLSHLLIDDAFADMGLPTQDADALARGLCERVIGR